MADSNDNLTKICIGCGQPKPLTAYLKMPGAKGSTIYGSMCSECRKANLEKLKQTERDESTRSSTGFKIDAKAKVADDAGKIDSKLQLDLDYHEERDENEENLLIKEEKDQHIASKERQHRDERAKKEDERIAAKSEASAETIIEKKPGTSGVVDLSVAVIDTAQPKAMFQSADFLRFKKWLGSSAPIVGQAEKAATRLGVNPLGKPEEKKLSSAGSEKKPEVKTSSMFGETTEKKTATTSVPTKPVTQTVNPKPEEKPINNLFTGIINKRPETPTADPLEFAKQNTPPNPTTRRR